MHGRLAPPPAQEHELPVDDPVEVHEAALEVLQQHAERVDPPDVLAQRRLHGLPLPRARRAPAAGPPAPPRSCTSSVTSRSRTERRSMSRKTPSRTGRSPSASSTVNTLEGGSTFRRGAQPAGACGG